VVLKENKMGNYVVDTSVIVEKAISKLIRNSEIEGKIIIPNAVLAELEHQANEGKETGMIGLEELQELQKLSKDGKAEIEFHGARPNLYQIKYAKSGGEIDALIRDLAYQVGAILITADRIQAESGKALGMEVRYIQLEKPKKRLEIERFFDEETMSVHLKENCSAYGKKGGPGNWKLVALDKEILGSNKVQEIAKEIVEKSRIDPEAFIEISRKGSTIVQYKNYRIVIVKPPVSDGWEITAVRPLKRLKLSDYNLDERLAERLKNQARGVLVAGETGSGKSTFSQSLAEYYASSGKVTKTVESPRDLILANEITQYSKNFASSEEIHDILFLTRPDYIIFDEVRDTPDFALYIDLRLGGGNVLGVLHSATPIDAVQRFITRLDSGRIPSVIDTIVFIEKGYVGKVLTLNISVKVPSGMVEADLARPVVEVKDFKSGKVEYEIYSYGEETVVVPVEEGSKKSPGRELASRKLEEEVRKLIKGNVKAELVNDNKAIIYVPVNRVAQVIGKRGTNIERIEKKLGISLDVKEM
jgi:ATPase